jgi:hypothetical protein
MNSLLTFSVKDQFLNRPRYKRGRARLYTKGEVRSWYSPCPQSRQTLAAHHANGNFVIFGRSNCFELNFSPYLQQ